MLRLPLRTSGSSKPRDAAILRSLVPSSSSTLLWGSARSETARLWRRLQEAPKDWRLCGRFIWRERRDDDSFYAQLGRAGAKPPAATRTLPAWHPSIRDGAAEGQGWYEKDSHSPLGAAECQEGGSPDLSATGSVSEDAWNSKCIGQGTPIGMPPRRRR